MIDKKYENVEERASARRQQLRDAQQKFRKYVLLHFPSRCWLTFNRKKRTELKK